MLNATLNELVTTIMDGGEIQLLIYFSKVVLETAPGYASYDKNNPERKSTILILIIQNNCLVLRRDRVGQLNDGGNDQDFGGVYDFFLYRYT